MNQEQAEILVYKVRYLRCWSGSRKISASDWKGKSESLALWTWEKIYCVEMF
jgi:hypothetical protein